MKKFLSLLPLAAFILVLSCSKNNDYHCARFLRPDDVALYVYADQEWDSVSFETTESYTLSSNVAWFSIPNEYSSFKNPYNNAIILCYAWLQFEPNTSGELRNGYLHLGAGEYSVDANIIQLPFLCVTNPARLGYYLSPLTVSANTESATLAFTVFSNWTLSTESDWLTLSTSAGAAGDRQVVVKIAPNMGTEDRTAKVVLTSRGVSEEITIKQEKPIDNESE